MAQSWAGRWRESKKGMVQDFVGGSDSLGPWLSLPRTKYPFPRLGRIFPPFSPSLLFQGPSRQPMKHIGLTQAHASRLSGSCCLVSRQRGLPPGNGVRFPVDRRVMEDPAVGSAYFPWYHFSSPLFQTQLLHH